MEQGRAFARRETQRRCWNAQYTMLAGTWDEVSFLLTSPIVSEKALVDAQLCPELTAS